MIPVRNHSASALLLALVTALALLAAPLCAPLCAGRACASNAHSSAASHGPCHEMAAPTTHNGDHYLAASKTCATPDFSAVLFTANEESLQLTLSNSAPVLLDHSHGPALLNSHASPGRWRVHRVPLKSKDFLPLSTILRI